jgi:ACT domain-containing protein
MPRVISHSDVESTAAGASIEVGPGDIVTPLARERAQARGVTLAQGDAEGARDLVRRVTERVAARLGDAPAEVLEAVVAEVVRAAAPASRGERVEVGPGIDFCAACIEQERQRTRTRAVLTTTGRNTKGIVARMTARIAELGGDILDISQTLVGDYFTMIIVIDTASLSMPFASVKEQLEATARELGLQAMMMHEDVVGSLHRV